MKKPFAILLMFMISLGFLISGGWWIAPAIKTFRSGERHPARISAMLRLRADGADMITGLRTEIHLECRNGDRVAAEMTDFVVGGLRIEGAKKDGGQAGANPQRFNEQAGTELLQRIARGNVDEISRVLRREGRENRDDGIVGLSKREIATGWFGLRERPISFRWDGHGVVLPVFAANEVSSAVAGQVISRVSFGTFATEVGAGSRKLTEPEFTRESSPGRVPTQLDDFVMFDGNHVTEYRPVLTYHKAGMPLAIGADLGKIKGESSAFRLFSPAYVYTAGEGQPLMVADLEALGAKDSVLSWFSSASEAVFSRWVYPAFFWSFGLYTLVFSGIALSLYIKPGKGADGGE